MRKLADQEYVDAPSSNYPKGSTRDRVGITPGTTGNIGIFGDIIQFFQRLIVTTGITENETPDNVSNGYQLEEALIVHRKLQNKVTFESVSEVAVYTMDNVIDELALTYNGSTLQLVNLPDPTLSTNKNKVISVYSTEDIAVDKKITINNPALIEKATAESITSIHSIMLRSNGAKWMILAKTIIELACPYLYINGEFFDEVLKNINDESLREEQIIIIPVEIGLNKLILAEVKSEISFIDYIKIQIGNSDPIVLAENIKIKEGESHEMEFISDSEKVKIIIKGYYNII